MKTKMTKVIVKRSVYLALLRQDGHDWARDRQIASGQSTFISMACELFTEDDTEAK